MKVRFVGPLVVGLVMIAGAAFAAEPQQSVAEILKLQHGIRERLESPHGEYTRFSDADIAKMERAQDKVFLMLDGVKSLDELKDNEKTDLSNALDEVKATLLANEKNRLICHRERKTGTNLTSLHCETVGEREANAHDAQEQMRELGPNMQHISGG
jgi:sulfur relay (sulfurtransferase) DsrF/TusC family protein